MAVTQQTRTAGNRSQLWRARMKGYRADIARAWVNE